VSRYRALDYAFELSVDQPLAAPLTATLEPLATSDTMPGVRVPHRVAVRHVDGGWQIESGDTTQRVGSGIAQALARTLEFVNQRAAASLVDHVPLHAAGTRIPGSDGVIAAVGRSGSGKSTLAAGAMMRGWGFVGEEIVAVDPDDCTVRPYHRPIGLRRGGAAALGVPYPDDDTYRLVYPWVPPYERVHDGTLVAIAFVHREEGCEPGAEPVSPARTLAEVVEHTVVPDDDRVVPVFHQLDRLVRKVPAFRLRYDTPADGVALLHELASAVDPAAAGGW